MYFLFAALLVVFKFALKIATNRTMGKVDIMKAALAFPLDLAFLCLSFGVIFLIGLEKRSTSVPVTQVLCVFTFYIVFAIVVALICRRTDMLFNKDESANPLGLATVNYAMTFLVLALSIWIQ